MIASKSFLSERVLGLVLSVLVLFIIYVLVTGRVSYTSVVIGLTVSFIAGIILEKSLHGVLGSIKWSRFLHLLGFLFVYYVVLIPRSCSRVVDAIARGGRVEYFVLESKSFSIDDGFRSAFLYNTLMFKPDIVVDEVYGNCLRVSCVVTSDKDLDKAKSELEYIVGYIERVFELSYR